MNKLVLKSVVFSSQKEEIFWWSDWPQLWGGVLFLPGQTEWRIFFFARQIDRRGVEGVVEEGGMRVGGSRNVCCGVVEKKSFKFGLDWLGS